MSSTSLAAQSGHITSLGAAASGRAIVIEASAARIGGAHIRRLLPQGRCESVGPFVFLDHFGPFKAGDTSIGAHPHAGIDVITYLLEGANEHRDSAGHRGLIAAGGAQWMRAGSGALHAERVLGRLAPVVHGVQLWVKLPPELEDAQPRYKAFELGEIPSLERNGSRVRVVSGTFAGLGGPMELPLGAKLLQVTLRGEADLALGDELAGLEWGIYCLQGSVQGRNEAGGEVVLGVGEMLAGSSALPAPTVSGLKAHGEVSVELLVLAGQGVPQPLVFGGPFVYFTEKDLKTAELRFVTGEMGSLDGVPR